MGRRRKTPELTAAQDVKLTALDAMWRIEPDYADGHGSGGREGGGGAHEAAVAESQGEAEDGLPLRGQRGNGGHRDGGPHRDGRGKGGHHGEERRHPAEMDDAPADEGAGRCSRGSCRSRTSRRRARAWLQG